ncbi:flagellin [Desertibaculum subflavum]|uniref:flagellin n=1 Tax=Desertibaculum subflavum TaxID=2268458 RepID=UPI000E66B891
MADLRLSAAVRNNLLSLQNTTNFINRTQDRLSTGLKVSSALDDAVAFFQAQALSNRASDLNDRKDGIDQAISTLKAANNGIEALDKTVKQLKGIATSAKTASQNEQADLTNQFQELLNQLDQIAGDSSYQGLNLLNSTASHLSVEFSTLSTSVLSVFGRNLNVSGIFSEATVVSLDAQSSLTAFGVTYSGFSSIGTTVSAVDDLIATLDSGIDKLRGAAKALGNNVTFLQTRLDFTKKYVNDLREGSDKLTLADINEEGANLVALQTRQQLGIQALAFAGQAEQSVLSLFQ